MIPLRYFSFFILLPSFIICHTSCVSQNKKPTKSDFVFTTCTATYKNKPLPFEGSLDDWINLFGPYNRQTEGFYYIWDSLGLCVRKTDFSAGYKIPVNEAPVELRIIFVNLDSPIGQAGKLHNAYLRKSYEYVTRESAKAGYPYSEQLKQSLRDTKDKDSVTKYPYPLKTYQDTILSDGGMISKDMSLTKVNSYRRQAGTPNKFGYWDKDMDSKNERGSTKVKTGEFFPFGDVEWEEEKCAIEKGYYYFITLRYTEGVLEYIKLQKRKKRKDGEWK